MSRKAWVWTAVAAGATITALGILFLVIGLDDADKSASVVGALVSVAGLALALSTALTARRSAADKPGGQSAEDVQAGGIDLVDGAANVRIGTTRAGHAAKPSIDRRRTEPGDQHLRNVRAQGDVRMIRNVDGDVELD